MKRNDQILKAKTISDFLAAINYDSTFELSDSTPIIELVAELNQGDLNFADGSGEKVCLADFPDLGKLDANFKAYIVKGEAKKLDDVPFSIFCDKFELKVAFQIAAFEAESDLNK